MHLLFQPDPPSAFKIKNSTDTDSHSFSILDLSGLEPKIEGKDLEDHPAPLEGVGFSPNNLLADFESSNENYLDNGVFLKTSGIPGIDDHPGLINIQNGSTLPIPIDEFCSYVNQTTIGETDDSSKSLKDSLFDIPLEHEQEGEGVHVSAGGVIKNDQSYSVLDVIQAAAQSSECILVSETQDSLNCKRKQMDEPIFNVCVKVKKLKDGEFDPSPVPSDSIISPTFIFPKDVTNASLHEKNIDIDTAFFEIADPKIGLSLSSNTAPTKEFHAENLLSMKSLSIGERFVISESQDLGKEELFSIIHDSNDEYSSISCSDDELSKKCGTGNYDVDQDQVHTDRSIIECHTIAPIHSVIQKENISKQVCTTPNSNAKKDFLVSAYSSSSELDNSNDEDYHPTQRSPNSLINTMEVQVVSPKIKKVKKSARKYTASRDSSELGIISSAKKRVQFQPESNKKKVFGGMRMIVTISSSNGDQPALIHDWMLDKTKLTKKIKEYGGSIVNDVVKSFQIQSSRKNVILITISPLRTKKFLLALALGIPIVSAMWIEQCINKGKLCDFNSFRLSNGDSILLGQPCSALKSTLGIFKGIKILIFAGSSSLDHNSKEAIKDWTEILLASDANIIDKSVFKKRGADFVLVLVSDLTEKELQLYKNYMVTTEYIIQCLRHQCMLSKESHPLFTSN